MLEYLKYIKRIIKVLSVLTIILIINKNNYNSYNYKIRTEKEISHNKDTNYIIIDNTKLIIESGNEKDILNNNKVFYMPNSTVDNYFLAGHNNKLVFNRLYSLNINDHITFHINKNNYDYIVFNKKYIDVDDKTVFNKKNNNSLSLITCSFTNQKRYIVECKRK